MRFWRIIERLLLDIGRAARRPLWRRLAAALLGLWLFDRGVYFFSEAQWQNAMGFGAAWRARGGAQVLLFALFGLFPVLLASGPWRALMALPPARLRLPSRYAWLERRMVLLQRFDARLVPLCLFAGSFFIAWRTAAHWDDWLLLRAGQSWGERAPLWNIDIGFWVFRSPGWHLLLDALSHGATLALAASLLLAIGRGSAQFLAGREFLPSRVARTLAFLAALWFCTRALRFVLSSFDLATLSHHSFADFGVIAAGPTFADWHARRPALWLAALFNLAPALLFLLSALPSRVPPRRRTRPFGAVIFVALIAPPLLQIIVPRLLWFGHDDAFLQAHIQATQKAWRLDQIALNDVTIERSGAAAQRAVPEGTAWHNRAPLWDETMLRSFAKAPVQAPQRARANRQAFSIGACDEGVAVFDDTRSTPRGAPFFQRRCDEKLALNFGPSARGALFGTVGEIDLAPWPNRLLWAWRLRSGRALAGGRLALRRNVAERQEALAPFFLPGGAPLPVIMQNRAVWLWDLLSVTANYPGSAFVEKTAFNAPFNAAFDAVKMTVDAQSGETHFYAARAVPDPLTQAWQRALPGLIEPLSAMPIALRAHRRYPPLLLQQQARQTARYLSPARWHIAQQTGALGVHEELPPRYGFWDGENFAAQMALSADADGETLAALLRASCDGDYGALTMWRFNGQRLPLDSGLDGPDALDARLAEQWPASQGAAPAAWVRGTVTPLFIKGRVWLMQSFYEKGKTPRLRGVALCDAAWQNGPVGVGASPQAALADWKRLAPRWEEATPLDGNWSLRSRLRQLLEPQAVGREMQIRSLIEEAARLHEALHEAMQKNPSAARSPLHQPLQKRQSAVLKKLQELTAPVPE